MAGCSVTHLKERRCGKVTKSFSFCNAFACFVERIDTESRIIIFYKTEICVILESGCGAWQA